MTQDDPSSQLYAELQSEVQSSLATQRPILHHLNADTSWLLQIPRPEVAVRRGARFYYNILIDPWFTGGQSDVASWFSQQFHATPSAIQSIKDLDDLIRESERMAQGLQGVSNGVSRTLQDADLDDDLDDHQGTFIDVVAVSHEFTDHCHKETLLELHPDVPVLAIHEAAQLIKGFKHFRTVVTVPAFGAEDDKDWRSTSIPPLPEWIGISRLLQTGDVLNYHSALMIAFNNRRPTGKQAMNGDSQTQQKSSKNTKHSTRQTRLSNSSFISNMTSDEQEEDDTAEAIIYTPHGIESNDLNLIPSASPQISTLALLHGLHNVRVGTITGHTALQSNLGAHNGLRAQRILKANYWIGTHDEMKTGRGLVAWFLQRDIFTVKDALKQERKLRSEGKGTTDADFAEVLDSFDEVGWVDLRNGESKVLV